MPFEISTKVFDISNQMLFIMAHMLLVFVNVFFVYFQINGQANSQTKYLKYANLIMLVVQTISFIIWSNINNTMQNDLWSVWLLPFVLLLGLYIYVIAMHKERESLDRLNKIYLATLIMVILFGCLTINSFLDTYNKLLCYLR